MKETVKNLAQLDGVFLIDEGGTILTAAAYLNIDQNGIDLPELQGFGTRHRCTAAVTKLTDAIGVVVSSSGGTVRVFKEGKAVLKLP
ncbi:DNA integrity scanning protein DisA nucleotide-binding domain protein [Candidatus Woesearchaeota archaeon]|nr:DNA integrity scanning protein DisA nucleotide-binding domain protein [Candidatus Woesearchaeota archaeon]